MLSSTVLEVAIGLVFCFASMSVLASSAYEAGASMFKLRARTLLSGVKDLLNDQNFNGLAWQVYNHALVNPISKGNTESGKDPDIKPSYIEPKQFALALIESVQGAPAAFDQLKTKIDEVRDPQLKKLLQGIYARAGGKIEAVQAELADWFDAGMERVSGTYKRTSQLFTFLIALVFAGLFNVDALHLFRTLWDHPALIAQLAMPTAQYATQAVHNLEALPVGWDHAPSCVPLAFPGWVLTASTVLFGAPFWFDLLQRMVNLRGAGKKPGEKDLDKK